MGGNDSESFFLLTLFLSILKSFCHSYNILTSWNKKKTSVPTPDLLQKSSSLHVFQNPPKAFEGISMGGHQTLAACS